MEEISRWKLFLGACDISDHKNLCRQKPVQKHLQQYDEVQITIGIRLNGTGVAAECYKHTQNIIEK